VDSGFVMAREIVIYKNSGPKKIGLDAMWGRSVLRPHSVKFNGLGESL
jgi:hypothetical protein